MSKRKTRIDSQLSPPLGGLNFLINVSSAAINHDCEKYGPLHSGRPAGIPPSQNFRRISACI
jgi:hypothetical protein